MKIKVIEKIECELPSYKITREGIVQPIIEVDPVSQNSLIGYQEGVEQITIELKRLRNPKLRSQAIAANGGYKCCICGFNYEDIYGELSKYIIEVHHLQPICHGERITTEDKVVVVCANCHRVLHHEGKIPMTIVKLKNIIKDQLNMKQTGNFHK